MNIKKYRIIKGFTQEELAKAIGVDSSIISKFEKGKVLPSLARLQSIADVLGVSLDDLVAIGDTPSDREYPPMKRTQVDDDRYYMPSKESIKLIVDFTKNSCELCGYKSPVQDSGFLEVHYIKWLSRGGEPTVDNMVMLCPNCHRKLHLLNDENDVKILGETARKHKKLHEVNIYE